MTDLVLPAVPSIAQRDPVELERSALEYLDATEVAASATAIGLARAERVSVELGALGGAIADRTAVSGALVAGAAAGLLLALLRRRG